MGKEISVRSALLQRPANECQSLVELAVDRLEQEQEGEGEQLSLTEDAELAILAFINACFKRTAAGAGTPPFVLAAQFEMARGGGYYSGQAVAVGRRRIGEWNRWKLIYKVYKLTIFLHS